MCYRQTGLATMDDASRQPSTAETDCTLEEVDSLPVWHFPSRPGASRKLGLISRDSKNETKRPKIEGCRCRWMASPARVRAGLCCERLTLVGRGRKRRARQETPRLATPQPRLPRIRGRGRAFPIGLDLPPIIRPGVIGTDAFAGLCQLTKRPLSWMQRA